MRAELIARKEESEFTNRDDVLLQDWRTRALNLESQVNKIVIGQERVVRLMNTALFARGHEWLLRHGAVLQQQIGDDSLFTLLPAASRPASVLPTP